MDGGGEGTSVASLAVARESARGRSGAGGKGRIDEGVAEGAVFAEGRQGGRWEDVASGGVTLEVAKLAEDYLLYALAGGVKGEDQGDSALVVSGGMGREGSVAGYGGDPGASLIYSGGGETPFSEERGHLR